MLIYTLLVLCLCLFVCTGVTFVTLSENELGISWIFGGLSTSILLAIILTAIKIAG